ncbi:MarR family winged helix-turn-helix transcriptional regulator [Brumimicrobium mesophilum]|uniref:MarR family winged helix-turn-helix transcriptional regulator n=1 Tax=Brumimicrobium mesophilum TaxID=392717 RepID=UPI000D141F59|nr:MarR family transcriptional regulator [Brumimicrobium mesophilum]
MSETKQQITPLGKLFAILTKQYLSILGAKLNDLPIDRYFYAFWLIADNDGDITSKRLSELLQTDKVLVVRILKYLSDKNFIERIKHPNDKRSFLLHVTAIGKKYVPVIEHALIETDQQFIDAIDSENKALVLSGITNLVNKVGPIEGDRIVLDYKRLNK